MHERIVVTATGSEEQASEVPYSATVLARRELRRRQQARSLPEALDEVTGVAVQKTAHGQGSPYIRGLTGFHTVFLLNGIRLNNSVFREGPNQYWATVDPYAVDRLELVRGPTSVLYGSDAMAGTVQAVATPGEGSGWSGSATYRAATAERSHTGRAELAGDLGRRGRYRLGLTVQRFGDLEGGGEVGRQRATGYQQESIDVLARYPLSPRRTLLAGHQRNRIDDAWRTHRTVHATTWRGTQRGSELVHAFDQDRQLTFLQLREARPTALFDELELTLSRQRQTELRRRVRADRRSDRQGFSVATNGLLLRAQRATGRGRLSYGLEHYRDEVGSWSRRFDASGRLAGVDLQGPVADDARYASSGAYAQQELPLGRKARLLLGARYSAVSAEARAVEDPASRQRIRLRDRWQDLSGNLRLLLDPGASSGWQLYGGVGQGFRAPNLSDLTRFDVARSNELEVPSPGLAPERALSYELGVRHHGGRWSGSCTAYYTDVDRLIVRVPTGRLRDGQHEVVKRNAGGGFIRGLELDASGLLARDWELFGGFAWLTGTVTQFPGPDRQPVREPLDKQMPAQGLLGLRWRPTPRLWSEVVVQASAAQRRLSRRDQADLQRIPPGGTPGYTLVTLRGGHELRSGVEISLAVENLGDATYRVHGSGVNGPGRNWVLSTQWSF